MRKLIGIVSLLLTVALLVMMAGSPSVASAQAGGGPSVAMSLVPPTAQVRIGSPLPREGRVQRAGFRLYP